MQLLNAKESSEVYKNYYDISCQLLVTMTNVHMASPEGIKRMISKIDQIFLGENPAEIAAVVFFLAKEVSESLKVQQENIDVDSGSLN